MILTFLKNRYGKLTVTQIHDESERIRNFAFNPSNLIDTILDKIRAHADLLEMGGAPLTTTQKINLAILLINHTHV